MGCSELHFRASGYGRGWINSPFMEFLLSTQHVKIADSNHLGFFFKEEGACAGVCALSLKKINLSGCSAALLFIFHFQHFKENNCRG